MKASDRPGARRAANTQMSTIKTILLALALTSALLACVAAEITFAPAKPVAEDAVR